VDLELEDGSFERNLPAETVILGNAQRYGGCLSFAREARGDDGVLEAVLLPSTRLPALVVAGVTALFSEMRRARNVRVARVRSATVRSAAPVAVHVDAEDAGDTPIQVTLLPHAVRLLAP
jgi:diacylglycerol kinase family enzyme